MELVGNAVNMKFLWNNLPSEDDVKDVDYVLAAIAYGSLINGGGLVEHCVKNKLRLDLWMRYDHTVPVAIPLLQKLLSNQKNNVFTKFIPDKIHTKVIWWRGYGAYIGSANHTDSAWNNNLELGVFLSEDDIVKNGFDLQFEAYFDYLMDLDVAISLDQSYIDDMEHLKSLQGSSEAARSARKHELWGGPILTTKDNAGERRKASFKTEWLKTLGILENIGEQLGNFRPDWVDRDVPIAWQVDQFLHAYYYNHVGDKIRKPIEDLHKRNVSDPNGALQEELVWWSTRKVAPSREDETFYVNAPTIRRLLTREKVTKLTAEEFAQICELTHATKNHMLKVPASELGRGDVATLPLKERIPLFARLILRERNSQGGMSDDYWNMFSMAGPMQICGNASTKQEEIQIFRYRGMDSIQ